MLYWEFPGKQRAARKGDWKVVTINKDAPLELYNIKEDMTESVNLADKYPEMVAAFEKEMRRMRVPTSNWPLLGEFWLFSEFWLFKKGYASERHFLWHFQSGYMYESLRMSVRNMSLMIKNKPFY